jgi:hypothetical protein
MYLDTLVCTDSDKLSAVLLKGLCDRNDELVWVGVDWMHLALDTNCVTLLQIRH